MMSIASLLYVLTSCAASIAENPPLAQFDLGRIEFSVRDGFSIVRLSGYLILPGVAGAGPFPAVVMLPGCSGESASSRAWRSHLFDSGYAIFVVDSLSGRGLSEVCTKYSALLSGDRIADAATALILLASHPRIDAGRIAVFGLSHGGGTVLQMSDAATMRRFFGPNRPKPRILIALYPRCADDNLPGSKLGAPLRIHVGELDDWTPASECQQLVNGLVKAGNDASVVVYPDAHHAFDAVGAPTYLRLPDVQNFSSGQLRYGATLGYSASATREAYQRVVSQLEQGLR